MDARQELLSLPRGLAEMLENGRPEYEALLRRTRWGEGPIYLLAGRTSWHASLTGVYAFETLLGRPAVARGPTGFAAYSMSLLGPGVLVIAISPPDESPAVAAIARAARMHGANLLVLTGRPEITVARAADGVLRLRAPSHGATTAVHEQAAMSYLGLLAARIFKKPQPLFEVLEKEFRELPEAIERLLHQMSDASGSLASELTAFRKVYVLGGGFYYPSALQAEHLLRGLGGDVQVLDPTEPGACSLLDRDSVVMAISGSRCRVKPRIHEALKRAGESGMRILAITDNNDRELAELSGLTVLLPTFTEVVGAVLASSLIHCIAQQMACHSRRLGPG